MKKPERARGSKLTNIIGNILMGLGLLFAFTPFVVFMAENNILARKELFAPLAEISGFAYLFAGFILVIIGAILSTSVPRTKHHKKNR